MKGDIASDVLWIIALSVLIFLIIFYMVPKFWKDIAMSISRNAPNVVARDLASLVTISGAAPHTIIISYKVPTEKYSYNLNIDGRKLDLEMLGETKHIKGIISKASNEIPIDPQTSIYDTRTFVIEKYREGSENMYEVNSK